MKSGLRHQLAEKMAGEITLSDSPGLALKKWRQNFEIAPGVLSDRLGVSPSVISDYESGRRKSPGTAVVGKIVDTLISIDEESDGKHINKFSSMLFSGVDDDVILDIHEYTNPVVLDTFTQAIKCTLLCGPMDQTIFGYTVINSLNAILQLSAEEFNRIYGWSTERALIFTNVSTGKSPMVAIRVTPFKPRCVILQGIGADNVHPFVTKMADRDHITVLCTEMDINKIVSTLREKEW
jgi:putative transcriptional regulator